MTPSAFFARLVSDDNDDCNDEFDHIYDDDDDVLQHSTDNLERLHEELKM